MSEIFEDIWFGLYGESWKGIIVDDAFAHPAKFSRALIRKIYDHVIAEGWAKSGDRVIDPFGGVALGGFDAMRHGLYWHGHELEGKFVTLGNKNIELWNERFSRMPKWGVARLVQGDSRRLTAVWAGTSLSVTSPPYAGGCAHTGGDDPKPENLQGGNYHGIGLSVSSPPYANDTVNDRNGIDLSLVKKPGGHNSQSRKMSNYGEASGQLGAMKEGDHSLVVSSPPYADAIRRERPQGDNQIMREKAIRANYGNSDGQLEGMSMGGFQAAVSSPPYEGCESTRDTDFADKHHRDIGRDPNGHGAKSLVGQLSNDPENIGNQRGETFWSASRLILEQLHQVLTPDAHAIFVVKAFVRDKKIVDFPAQWAQLCEAVGFTLLHHHRASLVEHSGTQGGFEEDREIRVERKSLFRRLAEAKGSPRIDHESVLCLIRR